MKTVRDACQLQPNALSVKLSDKAHNAFEVRYHETIDPDKDRWELCSRVLSRRDIVDRLSAPW